MLSSRRFCFWMLLLMAALLMAALPGCGQPSLEIHGYTMGTTYTVKVDGEFPGGQHALQTQIDALMKRCNDEISTYDAGSVLSRFNQQQSIEPFPIPLEMADILSEAIRIGRLTDGLLDVTVGPIVNLWGFGPEQRPVTVPTDAQIAAARARVGIQHLHVDVGTDADVDIKTNTNKKIKTATLRKDLPDISVDLSTFGEGWGVDRVAAFLEAQGVSNYLVEIAGASRSRGVNQRGEAWRLGIQKPTDEYAAAQAVIVPKGRAVSTSGSYRNYYERDGQRYSHIIDPRTGKPITHRLVSATVIATTALEADGWDTALMVMGTEAALQFAEKKHLAVYLITKTDAGFSVSYTPEFAPYLLNTIPQQ